MNMLLCALLIVGLMLIITFILIKTIQSFKEIKITDEDNNKTPLLTKKRLSKVSHRELGAWYPDQSKLGNNNYEPLIDRATIAVESTASRDFMFSGVVKSKSQIVIVSSREELKKHI